MLKNKLPIHAATQVAETASVPTITTDQAPATVSTPVINDIYQNEVERLTEKRNKLIKLQDMMKLTNKIIRKAMPKDEMIKALVNSGLSEKAAIAAVTPDCIGRIGFAQYQLTSNNAAIKRIEEQIKAKQASVGKQDRTIDTPFGSIELCYTEDRIRIRFDERTSAELCSHLKHHGFKWSPTNEAWQRQLTQNAIRATNWYVIPELQKTWPSLNLELD